MAEQKSRKGRLIRYAALAIVLLCIVSIVFTPSDTDDQDGDETEVADSQTTPLPEATDTITNTPGPTDTPRPTNTPLPPTNTPEPIILSGTGQFVTDPFLPPAPVSAATFSHSGSSNFAVWVYYADGSSDLLINEIGSYQGVRPLFAEDETFFEIDANGAWEVVIVPLEIDQSVIEGISGSGDYVSPLFVPDENANIPYEVSHDGQSNFAVWLHCADDSDLVQNEIGQVSGSTVVRFGSDLCLWEVMADGNWSLTPR